MNAVLESVRLIDTDAHVIEPPDVWTARMPKKWADQTPFVTRDAAGQSRWKIGDTWFHTVGFYSRAGWMHYPPTAPVEYSDIETASYDAAARLKKMDEHGIATGTVKLTWTGSRALELRQLSLRRDNAAFQKALTAEASQQIPRGMSVEIDGIANADDSEKPLIVSYAVHGPIGAVSGGQLQMGGSLFEASTKSRFASTGRQTPVYFGYPFQNTDAVRIAFAKDMTVKSVPAPEKLMFQKTGAYSFTADSAPGSVTFRRDLVVGNGLYPVNDYSELRGFFEQVETKDREPAVLALAVK